MSHKADNELTVLARALDMFAYNPECTIMEYDPKKDQGGSNKNDDILFQKRFLSGFDGLAPVNKLNALAHEYDIVAVSKEHCVTNKILSENNFLEKKKSHNYGVSIIVIIENNVNFLNLLKSFLSNNSLESYEIIIITKNENQNLIKLIVPYATRSFIRILKGNKNGNT